MLPLKKHIALILVLLLITPTIITTSHSFLEDHEHTICTSKTDMHIHELENDCSDLHLQLEVFHINLANNYELLTEENYTYKSVDKTQQLNSLFFSPKSSRGPPSL